MSWCLLKRLHPRNQMHRNLPQRRDECALVHPPRRRGAAELRRCPRGACKRWREPGQEPFEQIESILRPPEESLRAAHFVQLNFGLHHSSVAETVAIFLIAFILVYGHWTLRFFNWAYILVQNRNEKMPRANPICHSKTSSIIICLVGWPFFILVLKRGRGGVKQEQIVLERSARLNLDPEVIRVTGMTDDHF